MSLVFTQKGLSARNTASETSYAISPTAGQTVARGSLAVLFCAYDNSGASGADPFSSISDSLGNTWTSRFAPLNDPGAASAGAAMRAFTCRVARAITATDVITISFGANVTVARAFVLWESTSNVAGGYAAYVTGNSGTASSTTVSLTTGSIPVGDAVLASMGGEGNSLNTGDADTTNGSWSAVQTTAVGSTTSGIQIQSQNKIQTTTGSTQTYNPTVGTSEDLCAIWLQIHEVVPAYAHSTTVTIDHTKVGASDSTDFPFYLDVTQAVLKTVANSGQVQSSSGFDIGFYSNVGLTTRLSWEIDGYVATTGRLVAHVKIPTLSHTADTVIYLAWGDANITEDISSSHDAWSNGFAEVVHFGDGTTLTAVDSTGQNANGTIASATAATGQLYGGESNASFQDIDLGNGTPLQITGSTITLSAWVKPTTNAFQDERVVAKEVATNASPFVVYGLIRLNGGTTWGMRISSGGSNADGTNTVSNGAWSLVHGVYDGSNVILYVNGIAGTGTPKTGTITSSAVHVVIGGDTEANQEFYVGLLDEVRIANVVRSADWITAEYNNQSNPATFSTLGNATVAIVASGSTFGLVSLTDPTLLATLTRAASSSGKASAASPPLLATLTAQNGSAAGLASLTPPRGFALIIASGSTAGLARLTDPALLASLLRSGATSGGATLLDPQLLATLSRNGGRTSGSASLSDPRLIGVITPSGQTAGTSSAGDPKLLAALTASGRAAGVAAILDPSLLATLTRSGSSSGLATLADPRLLASLSIGSAQASGSAAIALPSLLASLRINPAAAAGHTTIGAPLASLLTLLLVSGATSGRSAATAQRLIATLNRAGSAAGFATPTTPALLAALALSGLSTSGASSIGDPHLTATLAAIPSRGSGLATTFPPAGIVTVVILASGSTSGHTLLTDPRLLATLVASGQAAGITSLRNPSLSAALALSGGQASGLAIDLPPALIATLLTGGGSAKGSASSSAQTAALLRIIFASGGQASGFGRTLPPSLQATLSRSAQTAGQSGDTPPTLLASLSRSGQTGGVGSSLNPPLLASLLAHPSGAAGHSTILPPIGQALIFLIASGAAAGRTIILPPPGVIVFAIPASPVDGDIALVALVDGGLALASLVDGDLRLTRISDGGITLAALGDDALRIVPLLDGGLDLVQ